MMGGKAFSIQLPASVILGLGAGTAGGSLGIGTTGIQYRAGVDGDIVLGRTAGGNILIGSSTAGAATLQAYTE